MSLARRLSRGGPFALPVPPPEFSLTGPYDPGATIGATVLTQLHCHTNQSDGQNSPAVVVGYYAARGYGALQITDHNKVTAQPAGITTAILGNEVTNTSQHIIATNSTYTGTTSNAQAIIDGINAVGGKAHIAHPKWSTGMSYAEMMALTGHVGLEIHNSHCIDGAGQNPVNNPGYAVDRWDQLLTAGRTDLWGVSVDDIHAIGAYDAFDVGRIQVFVEANTLSNVVAGFVSGSFVADVSNYGVTPGYPERTAEGVGLTCAGATRMEAIGTGGSILATATGDTIAYTFGGGERYVRLVAVGDFTEPFASLSDRWRAIDGTWAATGGVLALTSDTTTRRIILRQHRDSDFSAQIDVNLGADADAQAALMFNVLTNNYWYACRIGPSATAEYNNKLAIARTTNGGLGAPNLVNAASFTAAASTWYTIKMDYAAATGTIRAKVWERGTAEPDWMASGTDTTWRHGAFGIRANRSCQFDNLYIDGFRTFYQPITVEAA